MLLKFVALNTAHTVAFHVQLLGNCLVRGTLAGKKSPKAFDYKQRNIQLMMQSSKENDFKINTTLKASNLFTEVDAQLPKCCWSINCL